MQYLKLGMAGRTGGSGRIPLPPSMGGPGGAGGYRHPYPHSMYLNEQQQENLKKFVFLSSLNIFFKN